MVASIVKVPYLSYEYLNAQLSRGDMAAPDLWDPPDANALQSALNDPQLAEHSKSKWEIVAF